MLVLTCSSPASAQLGAALLLVGVVTGSGGWFSHA